MLKKFLFGVLLILLMGLFAFSPTQVSTVDAAGPSVGCGQIYQQSDIPSWGERSFNIWCQQETTVYVGVCDIGGDQPDDLFQVRHQNGTILSQNARDTDGHETVSISQLVLHPGNNRISLKSVSASGHAPYLLIMRSDAATLGFQLLTGCGFDYVGEGKNSPGPDGSCNVDIQIFMTDPAPKAGKIIVTYQYGQLNRPEGILRASTIVAAGERVDWKVNVPAPKWIRVWFQEKGSGDWKLLPSQYWQGDGEKTSEYGIWCAKDDSLPSYHTSFSKGISMSRVPRFNIGH